MVLTLYDVNRSHDHKLPYTSHTVWAIQYAQAVLNIFRKIMTKVAQNPLFNLLSVAYRGRSWFFVALVVKTYPFSNYFHFFSCTHHVL